MPTSISVELVPRSEESVLADAEVAAEYPQVTHINIPDIERFPLRSVDAIRVIREKFGDRFVYVPHIRAISSTLVPESFPGDIALVVQGDIPSQFDPGKLVFAAEHIALASDHVRVMGGIDPYRSSPQEELVLIARKISAGATGFFTQPFFSLQRLCYWNRILPQNCEIFYGVSPITTESSLAYWKEKNHVVFPKNFSIAPEWQTAFARKVIRWAKAHDRSLYLMPIRVSVAEYLHQVFQ